MIADSTYNLYGRGKQNNRNDDSFHCYPWLTYGWEGKVHLGDKELMYWIAP